MNEANRLHGIWRLVSFLQQGANGKWGPAFDAGAHGCISYWPEGRMQVLIGAGDRPRLRGEWSAVAPEQKAVCLDRMVAYAGSYSIEGDRVLHHVDTCWIPNWEGRDLVRAVSFPSERQLLLATEPGLGGRAQAAQRVLWERMA